MSTYRTRIAPTPSGYLHEGNVVNALYAWVLARMAGGEVLLRIDDVDIVRVREEYVHNIFETFQWIGIDWDIGPTNAQEFYDRWSQRHRTNRYRAILDDLRESNKLFACTCTRSQIRAADASMRYAGTCEHVAHTFDADGVSWRLRTPATLELPYVIVRQKEGNPAYNLASVVDDVDFCITHIVRGSDLQPASEVQHYLAECLPALAPFTHTHIIHHPLLLDEAGNKISKSSAGPSEHLLERTPECKRRIIATTAEMMSVTQETINELLERSSQ